MKVEEFDAHDPASVLRALRMVRDTMAAHGDFPANGPRLMTCVERVLSEAHETRKLNGNLLNLLQYLSLRVRAYELDIDLTADYQPRVPRPAKNRDATIAKLNETIQAIMAHQAFDDSDEFLEACINHADATMHLDDPVVLRGCLATMIALTALHGARARILELGGTPITKPMAPELKEALGKIIRGGQP